MNIYPQECENLLITHPKIADAAVFGVPNTDLGEEVKAVVQPKVRQRPRCAVCGLTFDPQGNERFHRNSSRPVLI